MAWKALDVRASGQRCRGFAQLGRRERESAELRRANEILKGTVAVQGDHFEDRMTLASACLS